MLRLRNSVSAILSSQNKTEEFGKNNSGRWRYYDHAKPGLQPKQSVKKIDTYVRYPAWSPSGNQIVHEYTETTGNIWMMEFKWQCSQTRTRSLPIMESQSALQGEEILI